MELGTLLRQLSDALTICEYTILTKTTIALEEIVGSLVLPSKHLATSSSNTSSPFSNH